MIASSPVPSAATPAPMNEAASARLELTLFPTSLPSASFTVFPFSSLAVFVARYPSASASEALISSTVALSSSGSVSTAAKVSLASSTTLEVVPVFVSA